MILEVIRVLNQINCFGVSKDLEAIKNQLKDREKIYEAKSQSMDDQAEELKKSLAILNSEYLNRYDDNKDRNKLAKDVIRRQSTKNALDVMNLSKLLNSKQKGKSAMVQNTSFLPFGSRSKAPSSTFQLSESSKNVLKDSIFNNESETKPASKVLKRSMTTGRHTERRESKLKRASFLNPFPTIREDDEIS